MATLYHCRKHDERHRHLGLYVDILPNDPLPVGPWPNRWQAERWITDNTARITELYGADAAVIRFVDEPKAA